MRPWEQVGSTVFRGNWQGDGWRVLTRAMAACSRRTPWPALMMLVLALACPAVNALDWGSAAAREVTVFYPGQVSWEKTLIASAHKGAKKIREGEPCAGCHADEEADMGAGQAKAAGFAGRAAATVTLRAMVAEGKLHLQVSGDTVAGKAPAVAFMLGSDALRSTAQAGCWAACHDDAPGMASDGGLNLGKYLPRSRSKNTATGGGANIRPAAELNEALAAAEFLEFMEIDAAGSPRRGYVLDRLHPDGAPVEGALHIDGSRWTAELSRPLAAGGAGQLALTEGGIYYFGVALHDPGSEGHEHLVSLALSLAVGSGVADLVAAGQ